ncbi:MAG: DUF1573 domain-containing protein [Bacteroidota bacterium]
MSRFLLIFATIICLLSCGTDSTNEKATVSAKPVVEVPKPTAVEKKDSIITKETVAAYANKVANAEEKVTKTTTASTTSKPAESRKEKPAPVKKKKKRGRIKFTETTHKFGTIKSGDKVKHTFTFTNTGDAPLVIKNVEVSCGCTFPSYPFLPIEPGDKGEIEVTFNSEYKIGRQKPTVTVITNGRPRTLKLYLEGFVE